LLAGLPYRAEEDEEDEEDETSVNFYFVPPPQRADDIQITVTTTIQTMWQKVVTQNLGIASISPTKKKQSKRYSEEINKPGFLDRTGIAKNGLAPDLNRQCEISQFFLFLPQLHRRPNVVQTFNFDPNLAAKRALAADPFKGQEHRPNSKRGGYYKTRRRRKKVFSKKVRTTRKRTKLLRKKFTKKKTKRRKKRRKTRRKRKNL
jgi:hypothetical protein